jgi:hypothetical protein
MTAMSQAQRSLIRKDWGETIAIAADGRALTVGDVAAGWRDDEAFRDLFIATLAASPYPAFFWEMPPVSRDELSKPFECAVIGSEALALMRADDSDFAEHLIAATGSVASFRNLGGDALLVAPSKIFSADCYAHFAAFLRDGPREQQHALFQLLAEETDKLLKNGRRFWISASGLGVPWVHVRLDSHPKYYQYRRYAEE